MSTSKQNISLEELDTFVQTFIDDYCSQKKENALVVGLSGNLGAGKTTFSQRFAKKLGVEEYITSPTFVIQKEYDLPENAFKKLIHIDAYRLKEGRELEVLGFEEILADPESIVLIEWPQHVADILPHDMITLSFVVTGKETRTITISNVKEED